MFLQPLQKGCPFGAAVFVNAFWPPRLFATQVAPTLSSFAAQAAVAFTSEPNVVRYLPTHQIY